MSSLWTPPGVNPPTSGQYSELDSLVELHDSDILAIESGPLAWANRQVGTTRNIDQFTKDLTEQFAEIGFKIEAQVWTTEQSDTWAFKLVIQKRIGKEFDPDRQVHEVVNNILDIPGEEAGHVVDTGAAMKDFEKRSKEKRTSKGGHFHG